MVNLLAQGPAASNSTLGFLSCWSCFTPPVPATTLDRQTLRVAVVLHLFSHGRIFLVSHR